MPGNNEEGPVGPAGPHLGRTLQEFQEITRALESAPIITSTRYIEAVLGRAYSENPFKNKKKAKVKVTPTIDPQTLKMERKRKGLCLRCGDKGSMINMERYCNKNHGRIF